MSARVPVQPRPSLTAREAAPSSTLRSETAEGPGSQQALEALADKGHRMERISTSRPRGPSTGLRLLPEGGHHEREADHVARHVTAGPGAVAAPPAGGVPPAPRPTGATARGEALPPGTAAAIDAQRAGGQPLPAESRMPVERALRTRLGGARVHTDGAADALNRSMETLAFTSGQHIFFRGGQYQPGSPGGQELLAHELTHVAQQGAAPGGGVVQARKATSRGDKSRTFKFPEARKAHLFTFDGTGYHSRARDKTVQVAPQGALANLAPPAQQQQMNARPYWATVSKGNQQKNSSMFPDSWNESKVISSIESALTQPVATNKEQVRINQQGTSEQSNRTVARNGNRAQGRANGVRIEAIFGNDGILETAYPLV